MMNAIDPAAGRLFSQLTPGAAGMQKFWLAVARLQGNALKAALRTNAETLAFARHRVERDIKLLDDLVASEGLKDAFDVYAGFVEEAVAQYSDEAGRLASLGSKIASETAADVRREADATVKDMAAATVA